MQEMKENFLRENANILGEEVCCMLRNIQRVQSLPRFRRLVLLLFHEIS